jgi:hypothetical protein
MAKRNGNGHRGLYTKVSAMRPGDKPINDPAVPGLRYLVHELANGTARVYAQLVY